MNIGSSKYLWICRSIFALLLLASIALASNIANKINIDTSFNDVSPQTKANPNTLSATNQLRNNIQQRITLLLASNNEDTVYDAEQNLRDKLSSIPQISVHSSKEDFSEQLIEHLKPYRFSLLSDKQQQILKNNSPHKIAMQAKDLLLTLSGQTHIYPFEDDPLGWHADTILNLLSASNQELNNNNIAIISLTLKDDPLNMQAQEVLLDTLDSVLQDIKIRHTVDINRSGIFFFAVDAAKKSKKDINLISTVSATGIILVLLLVFRSIRALILPLISIIFGVAFAFLITHSIYGQVHILTIVFGASLIGVVIDYSIHYFYHRSQLKNASNIIHNSKNHSDNAALHRALIMSLTTSLIGYAALSFSGLETLQKVAIFSCCGLFMSWLSVICLGDLALRKPLYRHQAYLSLIVKQLTKPFLFFSLNKFLAVNIFIIAIAIAVIIFSQPFDDNPKLFFANNPDLITNEQEVASATDDYEPGRYIAISGINHDAIYQRYQQFSDIVNQSSDLNLSDFTSVLDWVPSTQTQMENYKLQALLYTPNGAADQLVMHLSRDQANANNINTQYKHAGGRVLTPDIASKFLDNVLPPLWINQSNNIVSFILIRKGTQTDLLESLFNNVDDIIYINSIKQTERALIKQRSSATLLLFAAYILIAIVVLIRYQELNALWLVTIPICSSAMLVIISQVFGFSLNLFHVMALFLVLGFGMDYTIFAREIRPLSDVTIQAILLSAVTSLLSFGLLGLSSIPIVSSFGVTLLVGNLFNLLGVIIYSYSMKESVNRS